jgi:hypothetical protein
MMTDISAIRLKLVEIIIRAENDRAFRDRLAADPATVLAENGIPANAVQEWSRTINQTREGDITDRGICIHTHGCRDFTCFSSGCPNSCYVSLVIDAPDR